MPWTSSTPGPGLTLGRTRLFPQVAKVAHQACHRTMFGISWWTIAAFLYLWITKLFWYINVYTYTYTIYIRIHVINNIYIHMIIPLLLVLCISIPINGDLALQWLPNVHHILDHLLQLDLPFLQLRPQLLKNRPVFARKTPESTAKCWKQTKLDKVTISYQQFQAVEALQASDFAWCLLIIETPTRANTTRTPAPTDPFRFAAARNGQQPVREKWKN